MDVYRARSSLVWGWLWVGLGLIFAGADVVASGLSGANVGIGLGAGVAIVGVSVYLRPAVLIGADGVVFRNILHTASARYARIQEIRMRWSLEMVGDDGRKAGAFAVPASRSARTGVFDNDAPMPVRADDREGQPNAVGSQVYDAWRAWTDAHGGEGDRTTASIRRQPDAVGIALMLVAGAALAFAFLR